MGIKADYSFDAGQGFLQGRTTWTTDRLTTDRKRLVVCCIEPELQLAYADDSQGNRYFMDPDSMFRGTLQVGTTILARVNSEGYIVEADLISSR